ncbi:hypothetical protein B0H13DRAFT_1890945 [Mycena leptocephala]|nr:hypothetical protein B0H13DRAFT_1890945 [Mycena leptocephala]
MTVGACAAGRPATPQKRTRWGSAVIVYGAAKARKAKKHSSREAQRFKSTDPHDLTLSSSTGAISICGRRALKRREMWVKRCINESDFRSGNENTNIFGSWVRRETAEHDDEDTEEIWSSKGRGYNEKDAAPRWIHTARAASGRDLLGHCCLKKKVGVGTYSGDKRICRSEGHHLKSGKKMAELG